MVPARRTGVPMDFTLNGRPVSIEAEPGTSLLELLREGFGLRSMKDGCAPEGSCGACTVHRRRPRRRVVRPAGGAVAGREVVTLEGLPADVRGEPGRTRSSRPARRQCGFCSPGIVMKAEALLRARARAVARGDRPGPGRQPLPLHRLREDHRRDRAGRGRRRGAASGRRRGRGRARAAAGPARRRRRRAGRPDRRPRAGPRRAAVRRRHDVARHAPRRAALRRPPAGGRPADRHDPRRARRRASSRS